jgi:DNA processing protein
LRSSLLAELSAVLDLRARDRSHLIELLAREDQELIGLLGGRRREALGRAHRRGQLTSDCAQATAVCIHHRLFPRRLRAPSAPRLLYTDGDDVLLLEGEHGPAVALLGTRRPSDYGVEMAQALSYALTCSGVLVVTLHGDGIARAARAGAEQARRGAVLLSGNGLEATRTVDARGPAARALPGSCLAGELPPGCRGRRWGRLAAERTVVQLSDLVLVVEAESAHELLGVELAGATGVRIAAVPGRATAALARGPLELLAAGAALVRSADDVLELLGRPESCTTQAAGGGGLPVRLARVLDRVGSGQETPEQLLSGADREQVLLALAQLELMGRVRRTPDGRYLATAGGGRFAGPLLKSG